MMASVARYRHQVFVQRLGWKLRCRDGLEYDQYDRADTVYIVAQERKSGEIRGTARLLPTTAPYLLRDVFPQLLHGLPAPSSPDIWELSRFAAVDLRSPAPAEREQFSLQTSAALLHAVLTCAAKHGAHQLVTVSPIGVEQLLSRAGFVVSCIAPPVTVDRARLLACWIEVGSEFSGR
jgi:N-acyl-L-homoserine lactone synthetase